MAADKYDFAWDTLEHYGVHPDDDSHAELDEDDMPAHDEHAVCGACRGDAFKIGALGWIEHYRCVNCGAITTPYLEPDEEDEEWPMRAVQDEGAE